LCKLDLYGEIAVSLGHDPPGAAMGRPRAMVADIWASSRPTSGTGGFNKEHGVYVGFSGTAMPSQLRDRNRRAIGAPPVRDEIRSAGRVALRPTTSEIDARRRERARLRGEAHRSDPFIGIAQPRLTERRVPPCRARHSAR